MLTGAGLIEKIRLVRAHSHCVLKTGWRSDGDKKACVQVARRRHLPVEEHDDWCVFSTDCLVISLRATLTADKFTRDSVSTQQSDEIKQQAAADKPKTRESSPPTRISERQRMRSGFSSNSSSSGSVDSAEANDGAAAMALSDLNEMDSLAVATLASASLASPLVSLSSSSVSATLPAADSRALIAEPSPMQIELELASNSESAPQTVAGLKAQMVRHMHFWLSSWRHCFSAGNVLQQARFGRGHAGACHSHW